MLNKHNEKVNSCTLKDGDMTDTYDGIIATVAVHRLWDLVVRRQAGAGHMIDCRIEWRFPLLLIRQVDFLEQIRWSVSRINSNDQRELNSRVPKAQAHAEARLVPASKSTGSMRWSSDCSILAPS